MKSGIFLMVLGVFIFSTIWILNNEIMVASNWDATMDYINNFLLAMSVGFVMFGLAKFLKKALVSPRAICVKEFGV